MKIMTIKERLFYDGVVIGIFLVFLSIGGVSIANESKGEKSGLGASNNAIEVSGQLGYSLVLPVLKGYFAGNILGRAPLDEILSQDELENVDKLTSSGFNRVTRTWRDILDPDRIINRESVEETVVVSAQSDPYYSLAQKIAREENLRIVEEISDVLQFYPRYVILVASPQNLSEEKLLSIGRFFKESDYYPALGIISGSSIEKAEQLWLRRELAQEGNNYLGSDVEKGQSVEEPTLFILNEGSSESMTLNKNNLINTLKQADYFYWARHVTETKWFWNTESKDFGENDKLYAKDLPELKPVVIYTPSCGSFQPWVDDSIALGFIDQGAAAYIGHIQTPSSSNAFILRDGLSVPGIYTWKDFPLGIMAQVQNKMTVKVGSTTPLFFMLGDPRVYLSKDKPYQIDVDEIDINGKRIIVGKSSKTGILAVKIDNGAEYEYSTTATTRASDKDLFYNNELQMLNLGGDKYILFPHSGGDFKIELYKKAPVLWSLTDPLLDSLDYSWVAVGVVNSGLALVMLVIFAVVLLIKVVRQKKPVKNYQKIFMAGFLLASLRLIYLLLRIDHCSISATAADYNATKILLGFVGIFASTTGGLMIMKDAKKIIIKITGLLLAVMPHFLFTGFYFGFITLTNVLLKAQSSANMWLWNYNAFWLPFITLVFEAIIICAVYHYIISEGKQK